LTFRAPSGDIGGVRWPRALVSGIILAGLLVAGAARLGPAPALGAFLDPWNGVWALGRVAELPATLTSDVPNLSGAVTVLYDDRGVPHIFAATPLDAYRALGFVVARDRLFQLDLQTRATGGRLSELVGGDALAVDREQRRLGLAWSAERSWATLDTTSEAARAMRAYADGVNAWTAAMPAAALPLEYRLLGVRPMPWQPQYSLYLLRRMGYTLAYNAQEWTRERVAVLVGSAAADALFPVQHPLQEPIQPGRGPYPRFDVRRLPDPAVQPRGDHRRRPESLGGVRRSDAAPARSSPIGLDRFRSSPDEAAAVGSNNWAVSPRRSASGHALLAGDPHLELTLPSIWYEAHLVVPGHFDVYGVTIPGVPGILIGFNRDLAWSFTNTGNDVSDFYVETVDDSLHPSRYLLDGRWRPLERRIERYHDRRGALLAEDTLYWNHRGPLRRRADGRWVSMRWLVLEAPFQTAFLEMNRARSVDEWLVANAAFEVPAQNGVVADRGGSIAVRSTGTFPLRPGNGLGHVPKDGRLSTNDWTGAWPLERYPFVRDPRQGYVASANQQPKDPAEDPGYLDANWISPWRALRINALLRADSSVTVEEMRSFQTDPGSARADWLVPELLASARATLEAGSSGDERHADLRRAAQLLAEWDRRYTRDNERAVLFEFTMRELDRRLWDELDVREGDGRRRVATPRETILLMLLRDPTSGWWDDRSTPDVVETRDAIVAASLVAGLARARERHGDPESGGWRWDRVHHANVFHLLGISSLSALDLPIQGGPSTLNPLSGGGTDGASWRMVVELGPDVRAWGTYPGGQSGNPASRRYDDRIATWVGGELDPLYVPASVETFQESRVRSRLTLRPGARP
jgi:penicillin amidase